MQIKAAVNMKCNRTVMAMNALEDLLHNFQYLLREAKTYSAVKPETMFLRKRFLRAALPIPFAYAGGVTNRWRSATLEQRDDSAKFKKLQFASLDKKLMFLSDLAAAVTKPNLGTAKKVHNLLVHFKPLSGR